MVATSTNLAAITTDRFVATDNGTFWFVADTHDMTREGTARVKSAAAAKRWAKDVLGAEIGWDNQYFPNEGTTADGTYAIRKIDYSQWEITQPASPKATPVLVDNRETAALYVRQRNLYWVDQVVNFGRGSNIVTLDPETGILRIEVVVEKIAWADNSTEIVGHLGGRLQLEAPHGDICF